MPSLSPESEPESGVITFGPLRLDPNGYSVTVAGRDVALTLTEFLLLEALMESPYQVLTRVRLAVVFQSEALRRSQGPAASVRAIDTHISRLRAKLHDADYDCIRTMRHVGYRFVPQEGDEPRG